MVNLTPGSSAGGWCLGLCRFGGGDEQLSGPANVQRALYQRPNTLPSVSAERLSQLPGENTSNTHHQLFKWALSLLLESVNRKSGGEGRQRARVLGESEEEQRSCCKVLWLAGVIILQRWRSWMHPGPLPPLRSVRPSTPGRREGDGRAQHSCFCILYPSSPSYPTDCGGHLEFKLKLEL